MSKQSQRRARARIRVIEAAANSEKIYCEAAGVQWIQAAADEGQAPKPKRFSMLAYNGGPMQVNNYGPPVAIELAGMTAKAPVPILRDHDLSCVVGHADEVEIGDSSLKVAGIISGAGPDAAEVVASAGNGFPWRASVGVRPDKLEFIAEGVITKVNGKSLTGPLYVARKSTLAEVSFVALGADRKASAKVAASAAQHKELDMDFKQWIEALGLDFAALTDAQQVALKAKYDAEIKAAAKLDAAAIDASANGGKKQATGAPVPIFDLSAVMLASEKHIAAIQAETAAYAGKIEAGKLADLSSKGIQAAMEMKAKALNEEWPATRVEIEAIKAASNYRVELIRAERPAGPAIHASSRDTSPEIIQAAFCRTAGLRNLEKAFKPEVLEASDRFRAMGIQELLLNCAAQNGYRGRAVVNDSNLREVLRAAFPIEGAFSVHTIGTLLTQSGSKFLLEGFNAIPQTWREVATSRSVPDFKQITAFRLTTSLEYVELAPTGEIEHGTMGQESYTMQAKTYARMLALTRPDIINDDLGAFDTLRTRLGMGAVLKMNKVFWTAWLAASNAGTFWTAARGNYQTGGTTSLGEAALGTAIKLFRDAAGPDGNLLGLEPDRLLVPSDLEAVARKLYVSQEMRDTTASTKFQTSNIYFNRLRPVIVPELSKSTYTGYSATAWWLACNPAVLASAAMCFLNGVETPTIESSDVDFDQLGIQLRGYHDFGVAMTEYRASVHSAGA